MEKIIKNSSQSNKYEFKPFEMFQTLEKTPPKYSENLRESEHKPNYTEDSQYIFPPSKEPVNTLEPLFTRQQANAINHDSTPPKQHVEHHNHNEQPQQQVQQNNELVESLLKKIDDLSSNMIKMEMQMERQQNEFASRLNEERAQAKEVGAAEARAQLEAQYHEKIAQTERMIFSSIKKLDDISMTFESKLQEIEKDLTQTALHLASEVIKMEITDRSAQIATNMTTELLSKLKDATNIVIKVNSSDLSGLQSALSGNTKVKIEADEAVSKGGVIILSDAGNLDGQLSARFEKIKHEALS